MSNDKKGLNLGCTSIGCLVLFAAYSVGAWQAASVGGKAWIAILCVLFVVAVVAVLVKQGKEKHPL